MLTLTLKPKWNAMSLGREKKKLVKLKNELDRLELDFQQWHLKLYSLILDKEREA